MTPFIINILLAIMWVLVTGSGHWINLVIGFTVSYLALSWLRPVLPGDADAYFRRLPAVISFAAFFVKELILSNLRVAYDVITPAANRSPALIAVPLDLTNDAQITILANLITLTPGTLSLDIADDRKTLYIHAMFVDDAEQFRREIKEGFERRVLEVMS